MKTKLLLILAIAFLASCSNPPASGTVLKSGEVKCGKTEDVYKNTYKKDIEVIVKVTGGCVEASTNILLVDPGGTISGGGPPQNGSITLTARPGFSIRVVCGTPPSQEGKCGYTISMK
jgi:hypothetical protein